MKRARRTLAIVGIIAITILALPFAYFSEDFEIEGYAFQVIGGSQAPAFAAAPGTEVHISFSTKIPRRSTFEIEDLSGQVVQTFKNVLIEEQTPKSETPWIDGVGYKPSITWRLPPEIPSGVYLVKGLPSIFFVVRRQEAERNIEKKPKTAFLIPTNTINAYSITEKRSIYAHPIKVRAVSFLRPMNASTKHAWLSLARWFFNEKSFAPAKFIVDADMESPKSLDGIDTLILGGHSEYWSREARLTFDGFVDRGGNVIVAGGNVMWWQARVEDGGRRLTAHKKRALNKDLLDDNPQLTGNWTDPFLDYPVEVSIGGDFSRGGFGGRSRTAKKISGPGLRVYDPDHPLIAHFGLEACQNIDLGGVREYDGVRIKGLDEKGRPVAAGSSNGFPKIQILAWEWGWMHGYTVGTMHLYQKSASSGVVLHMGALECCDGSQEQYETDGMLLNRKILLRFFKMTRGGENVFQSRPRNTVAHELATPWLKPLPVITGPCGTERAAEHPNDFSARDRKKRGKRAMQRQ